MMNRVPVFSARIACTLALVSSIALLIAGTWASHHWPNRQDRHLFEYMGQRIWAGGTIYQDCWDNKPPLLPWINAAVLGVSGDSTVAITVAAGIAAGLTVTFVALGTWAWFGPAVACLVALLAAGTLSLRHFDGCTNGTELYACMFDSMAATAFMLSWRARSWRAAGLCLLAGLGFAAAFATKQNALAGAVAAPIVLLVACVRDREQRGAMLGRLLAMAAGGSAVLGAITWVLHRQGALDDAVFAIYTSNKMFVSAGLSWWGLPGRGTSGLLGEQFAPLMPLAWLAAIGLLASLVGAFSRTPTSQPPESKGAMPGSLVLFLAIWLCLAAYSVMWGGCHLTRYWHVCYVPLLWLSGLSLHWIGATIKRAAPAGRVVILAGVLTAGWLLAGPTIDRQRGDLLSSYHYATVDSERARILAVAAEVERRTGPNEPIYVWGYEPGIYRFSHRIAPTRYSELCKAEMLGAPAQFLVDEVMAALAKQPPRLILVQRGHLSAISSGTWAGTRVSDLNRLLQSTYHQASTVQGYVVFERNDTASRPK